MIMRREFDLNSVKEAFKNTMLTQQLIFHTQVHELHRIYGTQRTLMMQNDGPDFFGNYYKLPHLGHHDSLTLGDEKCKRIRSENKRTTTWFDVDLSREVVDLEDNDSDDGDVFFFDLNQDAASPDNKKTKTTTRTVMLEFDLNKACSDVEFSNEPATPSASRELLTRAQKGDSSDGTSRKEKGVDFEAQEAAGLLMNISFESKDHEGCSPEISSDSFERLTLGLEEEEEEGECQVASKEWAESGAVKIRRGRRRVKDFRREVLPGMASLTRHEIREDIDILEGVLRSREYKRMQGRPMADTWRRRCTRSRQGKRRTT